jgi:Uma2 family endonuclease
MAVREKLYTAEEFFEIAQRPENAEKRLELWNGVILEVAPPTSKHSVIVARILAFLFVFVEARNLGYVTGADGGYILAPGYTFIPDVGYISKERQPQIPDPLFTSAPDLAVEVVSPSNSPRELLTKIELYLAYGTRLVWVVYPNEQIVDVYRLADDGGLHIHKFTHEDTLDGEDVLPEFQLPVKSIFPQ